MGESTAWRTMAFLGLAAVVALAGCSSSTSEDESQADVTARSSGSTGSAEAQTADEELAGDQDVEDPVAEDQVGEDQVAEEGEAGTGSDLPRPGYAVSFEDEATSRLYRVDGDGIESIGEVQVDGRGLRLTDLAASPDGGLLGITFEELVRLDDESGEATVVGSLSGQEANALAFLPDGRLLLGDLDGILSLVDPSTGERSPFGRYPAGLVSSGDLVALADGTVYGTATDGIVESLVVIDVETGVSETVMEALPADVWGLMVSETGALLGLTNVTASGRCGQGELVVIDPERGTYEAVRCLDFRPGGAATR